MKPLVGAGSVLETITIKDFSAKASEMSGDCFICRYHFSVFVAGAKNTFHNVTTDKLFDRGMEYSDFKEFYLDYRAQYTYNHQRDIYSLAIQRLHISVIPENLPCRSNERREIEDFIRGGVQSGGAKKPMYICGTPGTGKTATVTSILKALEKEASEGKLPLFQFVEINCLRMKTPQDAYVKLWRGISGQHASARLAVKQLKTHFDDRSYNSYNVIPSAHSRNSSSHEAEPVTVCLLDELDFLLTRDFDVIYDFFNWPSLQGSRIVVVGIANTMNLAEMLTAKVASRAALHQMRVVFDSYTRPQIQEILQHRLSELQLDFLVKESQNFIAIKAASVAGDLRAALKICQQYNAHVKMMQGLISEAVRAYKESPFIASVSRACQLDKAILIILTRFRRQGSANGVVNDDENATSECDAGMTSAIIREQLSVMCGEIVNGSIMTTGRGMDRTNTNNSNSDTTNSANSSGIYLQLPPPHLFDLALERLLSLGILHRTPHKLGGAGLALYRLHGSFLFSDMLAVMREGDPMAALMVRRF
eukprot:gene21970-28052_t